VAGVRLIKASDVFRYSSDGFFSEFTEPSGTDELVLGRFSTGPGFKIPPHHHTCNTICYLVRGRAVFEIGADAAERLEMSPGDYAVIDSGIVHTEATIGEEEAEFILARDHAGGETVPVDPEDPFWK
jgi:quercetin dioxygenase-like cupin family protein